MATSTGSARIRRATPGPCKSTIRRIDLECTQEVVKLEDGSKQPSSCVVIRVGERTAGDVCSSFFALFGVRQMNGLPAMNPRGSPHCFRKDDKDE